MVDKELQASFNRIDNRTDEDRNNEKLEQKEKNERNRITQLRNDCWQHILARQEDNATEFIVDDILNHEFIYTTKDDIKSEVWIYENGIYVPNGQSKIKERTRQILLHAYTPQRVNKIIAKIQADTQIEHDKFFKNDCIKKFQFKMEY